MSLSVVVADVRPLAFNHSLQSQKTERHVFLLDGLVVCCKQRRGGVGEYRLKEKINMRKVKLIDMEESEGASTGSYHCVPLFV